MTSFRHQTAVLALVAAGLFPSVTIASPDSGTVGRQAAGGGRQMSGEYDVSRGAGVEAGNRAGRLPNERQYRPVLQQWLNARAQTAGRADEHMLDTITQALAEPRHSYYRFGAPSAGFEIDARHFGINGLGSKVAFMLRQDVKTPEEFHKLQQTPDPATGSPYISPNAKWQGEGKYPVAAFLATKGPRGENVDMEGLNPYDYVDSPGGSTFKDSRGGQNKAVVEVFGLPRDQAGVAHGQVRADFNGDFPELQGKGLSGVFSGLFGGGQQQQRQQPYPGQQQQYPGQQPTRPTDCPSATGAALGSFLGGLARGQDAKQAAAQAAAAAARTPKRPGCE